MLKLGTEKVTALYLGGEQIKKAYLDETVVFSQEKTIVVTVIDQQLSALLSAGTLTVAGSTITSESDSIKTESGDIDISFALGRTIKQPRSVSVNGINIGHVGSSGDIVSTTILAIDGMSVEIVFTNYT